MGGAQPQLSVAATWTVCRPQTELAAHVRQVTWAERMEHAVGDFLGLFLFCLSSVFVHMHFLACINFDYHTSSQSLFQPFRPSTLILVVGLADTICFFGFDSGFLLCY